MGEWVMGVEWAEGESGVRRWEQHDVGAKNRMASVQVSYRLYGSGKEGLMVDG
jgi:hypothetical protein